MSYKRAYSNKGLSARSRLLMEMDDERGLEENLNGNVLSDSVNYEGMEMPLKVTQNSANSNASPSPGSNSTVKRIRRMGKLGNFLPDEMELNTQNSPECQLIRRDLDGFYNCAADTNEVAPSQPGTLLQMKSFGNDPAYNGSDQNLRFLGTGEADAGTQSFLMGVMEAIGSGIAGGLKSLGFGGARQFPQPARPGPAEIEAKAKNYDDSTDLPKTGHATRFEQEMHPDFVAYAKAVIFDIWDQVQGEVTLNSTFRTVAKQKEMHDYVAAWRIANPNARDSRGRHLPPGYGGAPARPGYSKHNLGVAIDFSVKVQGVVYTSAKSKSEWEATGVPAIIKSNGLRWGGDFRTNYDPIHMDLPVDDRVRKEIVSLTIDKVDPMEAIAAMSNVAIVPGADNNSELHANMVDSNVPT